MVHGCIYIKGRMYGNRDMGGKPGSLLATYIYIIVRRRTKEVKVTSYHFFKTLRGSQSAMTLYP